MPIPADAAAIDPNFRQMESREDRFFAGPAKAYKGGAVALAAWGKILLGSILG